MRFTALRGRGYNHTGAITRPPTCVLVARSNKLAVLPVYEFPHMILRQKARKVRRIDTSIQRLVDDMIDTLTDAEGVGLSANQVGVLRRVIVIQIPEEDEPRVYINPEIIHREGEREVVEGCLSVPGYSGLITRSIWVKAKGLDRKSRLVRLRADGLLAQALEHEIDHLNGVLFMDHLKDHQDLIKHQPDTEATLVEATMV